MRKTDLVFIHLDYSAVMKQKFMNKYIRSVHFEICIEGDIGVYLGWTPGLEENFTVVNLFRIRVANAKQRS
jgi:hypothetical protein